MDWHNFKILSTFGVLVCIALLIIGKPEIAVLAFIGYSLYGLISCTKEASLKRKLYRRFDETVNEELKDIAVCHIMRRNPKLKDSKAKHLISEINSRNYTIDKITITDHYKIAPNEDDADFDYYLKFSDNATSHVRKLTYDSSQIGDLLWVVKTPTETMCVIQSKNTYHNLFVI